MYCNELKLSGVLEEFSITSRFLGSKMQKSNFEEKKRFECSFFLSNSSTGDCKPA